MPETETVADQPSLRERLARRRADLIRTLSAQQQLVEPSFVGMLADVQGALDALDAAEGGQ